MKQLVGTVLLTLLLPAMLSATVSKKIDRRFNVEQGQLIEVKGFSGSRVQFRSWEKPEVYVSLTVSISASDDKEEKTMIEAVTIGEHRSPEMLSILLEDAGKTDNRGKSFWSGLRSLVGLTRSMSREVEGEIWVPSGNDLSVHILYATVSLENMRGKLRFVGTSSDLSLRNCSALQTVSNDYGKTLVQNSGGSLALKGQSGTITVEDFDGDIRCESPYAKLRFTRIKRSLLIQSQSGDVVVDDVQGNVTVNSDYSPITVNNITGFADIASQSGTIRVRQVGGVEVDANYSKIEIADVNGKSGKDIVINSQSGSVTLENIAGNIRIDNPYSRMRLDHVKGNVKLMTQSGTIDAEDIVGDWDSETQYTTVRVNRLTAKQIRATNSSNPITFDLATPPSNIDIRNQYANVSVTMPKGFGGDVSLDVEYGTISTDLPLTTKNKSGSGYAIGKVGVGSGSIKIETQSGKISLNEK